MFFFKPLNNFRLNPLERTYTLCGLGLGTLFAVTGLLIDMQVRRWQGLAPGFGATFTATAMHVLALSSPLVIGRVFLEIGRRQSKLEDRLRQMHQAEALMREQAHCDAVTGLFNRSYLTSRLEEGIASRLWQKRGALVYMLDLDKFKKINDTFGHRAGDLVLIEVGRRLRELCLDDDIPVRLGGDEFLVVHFPQPGEGAEDFAKTLIACVGQTIDFENVPLTPGLSIGIARVGDDGRTWSDVMRSADIALYRAKSKYANAFEIYRPEMRQAKDAEAELVGEMKRGLDRNEFVLQFQPIIAARDGAIRSFEALVRWNHPRRGQLAPAEFIPAAESSGLIFHLGNRVLVDACTAAASWAAPIGVAVNLSPIQFQDGQLAPRVREVLEESGLAPGRLDLEVTESLLLDPTPTVIRMIAELREIGVKITMDDFGTGFSSLGNLRQFRFDRLKIDRSFTQELASGEETAEIVRTIVRMAATLRMETVLEGVENERQEVFAKLEGLDEVQGFFYAKPMNGDAVHRFLAERAGAARVAGGSAA
ncbi:MAG TPA: EAL domain-containing protein [Aurantimonas coralicida]|uniref:EAL domain-containing protein n=2 Tax=root TaxID=1 RepID=A0A9C9NGB9_9HYPH|nr:EAL domain-containing protein [Aurantimonas coralicida]HEU00789.1 EAL domain-containing protein [Aurantimonas coralicida]